MEFLKRIQNVKKKQKKVAIIKQIKNPYISQFISKKYIHHQPIVEKENDKEEMFEYKHHQ